MYLFCSRNSRSAPAFGSLRMWTTFAGSAGPASRRHRLLHGLDELLEAEGFGEKVEVLAIGQVLLEGVLGVARHEDDLQVRVALAQLAQQRRAVHLRHDHVRDHEVDR